MKDKILTPIEIKYCIICNKPIKDSGVMCPHCGEFNPCCGYLPDEYGA